MVRSFLVSVLLTNGVVQFAASQHRVDFEYAPGRWMTPIGFVDDWQKSLVLEDVITTGASSIRSIGHLRKAGFEIMGLVCLVDRMEGGKAAIEAEGVPVTSVYRKADFPGMSETA